MFDYIWAYIYAPPLRNVILAGVEQVTFFCDRSPVQYLSNISYHTGVSMVQFWLIRPNITNWPINQFRKHFRAKWLQTKSHFILIILVKKCSLFLSKFDFWPYLTIFGHMRWKRVFWMDWSLELFFCWFFEPITVLWGRRQSLNITQGSTWWNVGFYALISLIGQLTYQGSILGQNDLGLREIFLEVNCGHFSKKIESLRPSCQKLEFCPYKEVGVALERFPRRIFLYIFI